MPVLFSVTDAAKELGGISVWTLRKHVAGGGIKVVRIGRRVFLASEELARIRREGLPSLRSGTRGEITTTTNLNSQQEIQESCLTNQAR
jgi:hypothetical protein